MANTYKLIQTQTLASTATTLTFSSIPQTFTDLIVKWSAFATPTNLSSASVDIYFNASGTGFTCTEMYNSSNGLQAWRPNGLVGQIPAREATAANCFGNTELYIPNYTLTQNKTYIVNWSSKRNETSGAAVGLAGGLRLNTDAITSIRLNCNTFGIGSMFSLYGIKST